MLSCLPSSWSASAQRVLRAEIRSWQVESRLLAPSSPCLSTATRDSGVNSRESTHCVLVSEDDTKGAGASAIEPVSPCSGLTPRDGSQDESGSPVFEAPTVRKMMLLHFGAACRLEADKTWLTDKARSLEDLHLIWCCIVLPFSCIMARRLAQLPSPARI